jgi:hypothetical protein
MKVNFKMIKDILKEKGVYPQSRVYMLVSIVAYYFTLGILTVAGLSPKYRDGLDINNFKMIVDALQYVVMLFAGYTFGGKFIDVIDRLKKKDKEESK